MNNPKARSIEENIAYIKFELSKLKTLIHRRILWQRHLWTDLTSYNSGGMIIPDAQVDTILEIDEIIIKEQHFYKNNNDAQKLTKKLVKVNEEIKNARKEADNEGLFLPLLNIESLFNLSPFEFNLIILCLGAELEPNFKKLYGYIEDNVALQFPSPQLALNLFCSYENERMKARRHFRTSSPLFHYRIIHMKDDLGSILSKQMWIDDNVFNLIINPELYNLKNDFSKEDLVKIIE